MVGKIYKITSALTNKIYIGSTFKDLKKRLSDHKANYTNYKKGSYIGKVRSFELLDLGSVNIELLEAYDCNNKHELHIKEYEYIQLYRNICVNKNNPIPPTREQLIAYHKQYYNNNKNNKSVSVNCEICQGSYNYYSKANHFKTKRHCLKTSMP